MPEQDYDNGNESMMYEPDAESLTDVGSAEIEPLTVSEPAPSAPIVQPVPALTLEDLTLAEALSLLIYRPVRASQQLWRIIAPAPRRTMTLQSYPTPDPDDLLVPTRPRVDRYIRVPKEPGGRLLDEALLDAQERNWVRTLWEISGLDRLQLMLTVLLALAILFALIGADFLREAALDETARLEGDTGGSIFWFVLAAFSYLAYATYQARDWWSARLKRQPAPVEPAPFSDHEVGDEGPLFFNQSPSFLEEHEAETFYAPDQDPRPLSETIVAIEKHFYRQLPSGIVDFFQNQVFPWVERYFAQLTLIPIAILMSYLAYARNVATDANGQITGIVFTRFGFTMWVLALVTWAVLFSIDFNKIYGSIKHRSSAWQMPTLQTRWRWTHVALFIIIVVAGYFRLNMLDEVPPEMTSDHIEKLLDATRVHNGLYAVFFDNNGGREAFQMYTVAAIADWADVGFNFRALKYATIIEGMLTILITFGVVKEVIGRDTAERRQLGDWVGLIAAALMAISFWHVMLSRLGLRIVLTPLTVMLVTYYLVRAIRHNRRSDFVWLGLVLGLSTYFYQANRMLPILVVGAVVLAIVFNTKLRPNAILRYGLNLSVTALIAFVAYLPMYHYSEVYELEFWNRTYGRIFGEDEFRCYDQTTNQQYLCRPSFSGMIDLLSEERYGPDGPTNGVTAYEAFYRNYRAALTSYMYEGERQWITNVGGNPALDATTAGLYVLGVLMWVVMAINRRDVALIVVPIGVIVMILPSALAIAPGLRENPSFTRISGTAPFVFMMAALPLGLLALQIAKSGRERLPYYAVSFAVVVYILRGVAFFNFDLYFNEYRSVYALSWRPYGEIAAPLAEFVEGGGSYGNAFYVNYPHWLDHRIMGSVAGDMTWPNGLFEAPEVYGRMAANQNTPYAYDPSRPLLFYIHPLDVDDIAFLQERFPGGTLQYIDIPTDTSFYVYEVPAGLDWLAYALTTETVQQGCIINCLPGPR